MVALVGFALKELWEAFKGRGRKLGEIEKSNTKILTMLEGLATRDEARRIARDEIIHMLEMRDKA